MIVQPGRDLENKKIDIQGPTLCGDIARVKAGPAIQLPSSNCLSNWSGAANSEFLLVRIWTTFQLQPRAHTSGNGNMDQGIPGA